MDNDATTFNQPTGSRPPHRRAVLWTELAQSQAQLGLEPLTATYTPEALAEKIALARRAHTATPHVADCLTMDTASQQHAGASLEDSFGERILDGQQDTTHRRTHTTWRNFFGPLFFSEQPTPKLYRSTPHEDDSERPSFSRGLVEGMCDRWVVP